MQSRNAAIAIAFHSNNWKDCDGEVLWVFCGTVYRLPEAEALL